MSIVYLDNNATTIMPNNVIAEINKWFNKGNPSSSYRSAKLSQELIETTKQYILTCANVSDDEYEVILTSGCSESNAFILKSAVDGFFIKTKTRPHIVCSSIEHKSILKTLEDLVYLKKCTVDYVKPNSNGFILAEDVEAAIKVNTCLVCVMGANNETGVINDIQKISIVVHNQNIPFFSDYTQLFGKIPKNAKYTDAFCTSFHKLYGPPGIGFIAIKKILITNYNLKPLIAGEQNNGLRGGTENTPYIAGVLECLKYNFADREIKNKRMNDLKSYFIKIMNVSGLPCKSLQEYNDAKTNQQQYQMEIVFISSNSNNYLPNTMLIGIVKRNKPFICNVTIKNKLEKNGIIVSIGSACNTKSKHASHVVDAMNIDSLLRKGIIRISMCDSTTKDDMDKLIKSLMLILKECLNTSCDVQNNTT